MYSFFWLIANSTRCARRKSAPSSTSTLSWPSVSMMLTWALRIVSSPIFRVSTIAL
jgi:hypothetical protein